VGKVEGGESEGDCGAGVAIAVWVRRVEGVGFGEGSAEGGADGGGGFVGIANVCRAFAAVLAGSDVDDTGAEDGGFDEPGGGIADKEAAGAGETLGEAEEVGAREMFEVTGGRR